MILPANKTMEGHWTTVHKEALNFPYLSLGGIPIVFTVLDEFDCPQNVIMAANKLYHNELKRSDRGAYVEEYDSVPVFDIFENVLCDLAPRENAIGEISIPKAHIFRGAKNAEIPMSHIHRTVKTREDKEIFSFDNTLHNEKSPENPFSEVQVVQHNSCITCPDCCGRKEV